MESHPKCSGICRTYLVQYVVLSRSGAALCLYLYPVVKTADIVMEFDPEELRESDADTSIDLVDILSEVDKSTFQ